MQIGSALGSALQGINQATELLNSSSRRINEEGISTEAIVDSKIAENNFKANVESARAISETEETALDILA